uniref:Uncharacterized protein n=1 Tax=Panagrolaimus sp. JU765 TaxID=591449 RepID=A0AC34Q0Z8_9BILA
MRIGEFRAIFYFILIINGVICSANTPNELVQEIIVRFDRISGNFTASFAHPALTAIVEGKFENIQETTADFLKLAKPLGKLLSSNHKPGTVEYRALKKLNKKMSDRLERMENNFNVYQINEEMNFFT